MTTLMVGPKPVTVFAIVVAVAIAAVVLSYVRKWRLREEYTILWLLLSVVMVVLAAFSGITVWVADRLDVQVSAVDPVLRRAGVRGDDAVPLLAGDFAAVGPEPPAGAGAEPAASAARGEGKSGEARLTGGTRSASLARREPCESRLYSLESSARSF